MNTQYKVGPLPVRIAAKVVVTLAGSAVLGAGIILLHAIPFWLESVIVRWMGA